jgi:hypothetical protein
MLLPALLLACAPSLPVALPAAVVGEDLLAIVRFADTYPWEPAVVEVGLWGPRYATDGIVAAQAEVEGEALWLYLPLRTPVGEGTAALRLDRDGLRLPLGARPGGVERRWPLAEALPEDALQAEAQARAEAGVDAATAAWQAGGFSLFDEGGALVGALQMGLHPTLALWSPRFATPEGAPQALRIEVDGADLLLRTPIEPSLGGEGALLRLNPAAGLAVLPAGPTPDPQDLVFRVEAGLPSPAAQQAAWLGASTRAKEAEAAWAAAQLPRLSEALRGPDRGCLPIEALDPAWTLLLRGYQLTVAATSAGCVVRLWPEVVQHGRQMEHEAQPGAAVLSRPAQREG